VPRLRMCILSWLFSDTVSTKTVECQMKRLLINVELERIWKEAATAR
jgi:hypothetical protein